MEATTLNVLDVVGTWIAAIGTVGAVITSLWLSINANKEKLKIKASARILIDSSRNDRPMLCMIEIVNIGNKQSKINTIGWEIGKGKKKKSFWQNTNGSIADKLPKTILEGEEATFTVDFNSEAQWLNKMANNLKEHNIKDLKVVVCTSTETFKVRIDDSLAKEINKEKEQLSNPKN